MTPEQERVGQHPDEGWSVNVVGICHACRWRVGLTTCAAFPEHIPWPVLAGNVDHRFPLPGDHGIRFVDKEDPESPPVGQKDDLGVVCRTLSAEPLLHASLGSKELFHSNMLAWFCDEHPQDAAAVFGDVLTPTDTTGSVPAQREFMHTDLILRFSGFGPVLVENKTFSLPDESQLVRYATEVAPVLGAGCSLVLLSLSDPGWANNEFWVGDRVWRWMSYGELADRMRSLELWNATDYPGQTLAHDAHLLGMLDELRRVTHLTSHNDAFYLTQADRAVLGGVRLADAVGKMRAHQFRQLMVQQYQDAGLRPDRTEVGYSKGNPLVSAFWMRPDGVEVGWQLQGSSWRLALVVHPLAGRTEADVAARAGYARTQPWFDFGPFHSIVGTRDDGQELPFLRFNPAFVYTAQKLPTDITVRVLLELAATYGALAQQVTAPPP